VLVSASPGGPGQAVRAAGCWPVDQGAEQPGVDSSQRADPARLSCSHAAWLCGRPVVSFLWLAGSLAIALLATALGDLVSEEIRGRLDQVPFAILRMASKRLPVELRTEFLDRAWLPELNYILRREVLLI
jgi:hypothetical protein